MARARRSSPSSRSRGRTSCTAPPTSSTATIGSMRGTSSRRRSRTTSATSSARTAGGPIDAQQVLRVRRVRRAADRPGAAVPRQRAEPGVPVRQLLGAGHADSRSADRPAVPRQHHSRRAGSRTSRASWRRRSRRRTPRARTTTRSSGTSSTTRIPRPCARTRRSTTVTACSSGSCTTRDRSCSRPRSRPPTCRSGDGTSRWGTPG